MKKIKDLTLEECIKICGTHYCGVCSCPLFGTNKCVGDCYNSREIEREVEFYEIIDD